MVDLNLIDDRRKAPDLMVYGPQVFDLKEGTGGGEKNSADGIPLRNLYSVRRQPVEI